jgi:hypothetical protein
LRENLEKSDIELIDDYDFTFINIHGENWYIKKKSEHTFLITSDDERIGLKIKEMPINPELLTGEEVVDQVDFRAIVKGYLGDSINLKDHVSDEIKRKEHFRLPWVMSDIEQKWLKDCMESMRNPHFHVEKKLTWRAYENERAP